MGPSRAQPPGIALAELPPIDVVLLSHNHYDHLDAGSVQAIAAQSAAAGRPTLFLVPLGLKSWFASRGITQVVEMDWWDSHVHRGVEFHFTPVQHWSARGPGDRSQTLWGGYAVFAPDLHWYFSGDTGYSRDFLDTRARFAGRHTAALGGGFDLALIAVGAYEPRWFMSAQHVNPAEAVQIHQDLGARRSVGVHWGTFELTDEPLDQPPKDLATARSAKGLKDEDFSVMAVGETRALPRRALP
jgi:N-acyl-phosphatidylethanolamine-hydrolysing phospholipase D